MSESTSMADLEARYAALQRENRTLLDRLARSESLRTQIGTFGDGAASLLQAEQVDLIANVLEAMPAPVFYMDEQGAYLGCNRELETFSGFGAADLIGKTVYDLFPGELAEAYHRADSELLATRIPQIVETQLADSQGQLHDVLIRKATFLKPDGSLGGLIGVILDISERKRNEVALRESELRLRTLADNLPGTVIYQQVQESDGTVRFLSVSANVERIDGISAAAILEDASRLRDLVHEEDRPRMDEAQEISRQTLTPFHQEVRAWRGHELRWFLLSSMPRPDAGGGVVWDGVQVDITRQKLVEEELKAATLLAEDAARAKSEFLANMSHEIRTPLNGVIGLTTLILQTDLDIRQRDYLNKIQQSGQHLLGIINDILDFSKIDAGQMSVERSAFRLDTLLGHVSNLIAEKAAAKGLELIIDVAADVPDEVVGDSLRVGQVLINFANNAVKFTQQGEIGIVVTASERTERSVDLTFSVRDSGIGLSAEQIRQLFQPFRQADASTTRKYGGSGLGLVISKRLAKLMDGEVGVESVTNVGSTFWFKVQMGLSLERSKPRQVSPHLRGKKMLVVDDSASARAVLSGLLASMSFKVERVESGEEAIDVVQAAIHSGEAYDLVFLDWQMPGMDGIETARRIESLRGDSALPGLVMVTAYGSDAASREATGVGFAAVLSKPVTASTLLDVVNSVLRGEAPSGAAVHPQPIVRRDLSALRGARLLLVEDNELNQEVALGLLAEAHLTVDVVDDGQKAVALVMAQQYDGILMDMQMPVLDGIGATRAIRSDPRFGRMPIIAMTANAMGADREACLAAGMNDHVAKPIDPDELFASLLRWIEPRPSGDVTIAAVAEEVRPVSSSDRQESLTIPGIEVAVALRRMGGNRARYETLLRTLAERQRDAVAEILSALEGGDAPTAQRLAHSLKGAAANLGATALAADAARVEAAIKSGASVEAPLEALSRSVAATFEAIRLALPAETPRSETGAESADPSTVVAPLAHLKRMLAHDDPEASDHIINAGPVLSAVLTRAELESLQAAVNEYDFETAKQRLEAIVARLDLTLE